MFGTKAPFKIQPPLRSPTCFWIPRRSTAAGPCVFTDCVAKDIQAIDALWD